MKFKEILAHLTGVSVPIFGVQWKPVVADVTIARKYLRELEDRRVLYQPYVMENAGNCLRSVSGIRQLMTTALHDVDPSTPLGKQLSAIRRACRQFMDIVETPKYTGAASVVQRSILDRELGKLRRTVGGAVGSIAVSYGLDVEDELASIIPFNNVP